MSEAIIEALRRRYMESVGNPARQLIGGGVRGYLGLDMPEYADQLGREAYANAQALGNAPGIGAPAGAFKAMAAAPLVVKALRRAPRDEALEVARQNAVKMLGLPENNTAMDRARALGFDADTYHGTFNRFDNFDLSKANPRSQYMPGIFTADDPRLAENFGDYIMPLLQRQGTTVLDRRAARQAGLPLPEVDTIYDKSKGIHVTNNPTNIRSRFAAFDPARVNENDLLGAADPRLLGLIAAGTATGATVAALRNKREEDKKKKKDE